MTVIRAAFLLTAFMVTALALLPLKFALAATRPPNGIEIGSISGTVWSGQLQDVHWRGTDLGDLTVASSFTDRPGDLIMHVSSKSGPLRSALLAASSAEFSVENLSGAVELSRMFPHAPADAMLQFNEGALSFAGQACRSARVWVSTDDIPSQGIPEFEGAVACEKGRLIVSLASRDRAQRLKIAIGMDAASKPAVVEADAATTLWLASMGIHIQGKGQVE